MLKIYTPIRDEWYVDEWYVGMKQMVPNMKVLQVVMVQAGGDELQYILNRFPFILNSRKAQEWNSKEGMWTNVESMKFYGDDAKFIVGNLV